MRPDDRELDEELRAHLALSIHARVENGEDPMSARRAAVAELGHVAAITSAMHRVWYARWFDALTALAAEMRLAVRSLLRARGLAATVIVTLALGIGANSAIFSVTRDVLLRPLVNRTEDRLVYIRQSAPGLEIDNLTFSVPEIGDLAARVESIETFGDFSTIDFTLTGIGTPRVVHAGVVSGSFFDVMGLRPVLGRLLTPADDGPTAEPVVVLTHRFWMNAANGDPAVIGRTIRLAERAATVVGILEPSLPYPADTELIANVVTSPHHMDATMVTGRTHRMTELFGRLAPDATIEQARAEIDSVHSAMLSEHPEAYAADGRTQVSVTPLREQLTAPARPVLFILLGAAAVVFLVACSNVANLILARSVRRQGELALRAALGATHGALRRTLLAESLVLCGVGALLGVLLAHPLVTVVARYAARFSVRALDPTLDAGLLWVAAVLAVTVAVVLAFVPRLPTPRTPSDLGIVTSSLRITPATTRRLRVFASAQVACSFVLLSVAAALLTTVAALGTADSGYDMRRVLAFDLPTPSLGIRGPEEMATYAEMIRRVAEVPGVENAALGSVVPWRDAGRIGGFQFTVDGYNRPTGDEDPFARMRVVGPGYFGVVGVPLLAGREFTDLDGSESDPVVIVSERIATRLFPDRDALNRTLWWTDPLWGEPQPRRIVGIVADVDDENLIAGDVMTVYEPVRQRFFAGRLFVRVTGDPHALVPAVERAIRDVAPEQPVERPATLAEVRAEVLAPDRLHALVVSGFAGVAVLVAVIGLAGVLAFSVSARMREFGVRLALGSSPRGVLATVLREGMTIVLAGLTAGLLCGYGLIRLVASTVDGVQIPGTGPTVAAAAVLAAAALLGVAAPALRASRVNVLSALRSQ